MSTTVKERITIEATVNAPVEKTWSLFNNPEDIINWNTAIPEWHTPRAENDLRTGGKFLFRMEARDGSMGFDFGGIYDNVDLYKQIDYTLGDARKVNITFTKEGDNTRITETFDPESMNSVEMQRDGWQSILNSFKKYAEQ